MSIWRPLTSGILVGGVVLVVIAVAVSFIVANFQPKTLLQIGSGTFQATVASDDAARKKGLSGIESMKPDDALIMVFQTDDLHGIWMKDMKIPIDIIWLDADKRVVDVKREAPPELSDTKTYVPSKDARYVIELQTGSIQRNGIKAGDQATFTIGEK